MGLIHGQGDLSKDLAGKETMPTLLIFSGSDWCKPCIQLKKEVLDTPTFQKYAEANLILKEVDFPYKKANRLPKEKRDSNDALAAKYNPQGIFPSLILIDETGNQIANLSARGTNLLMYEIHEILKE